MIPPTSNPAEIYASLRQAIDRGDTHDYKIKEQRASIEKQAIKACLDGRITEEERDEIILLSQTPLSKMWRPLLYVIPKATVASRVEVVPQSERAGIGPEYRIKDLKGSEFKVNEP